MTEIYKSLIEEGFRPGKPRGKLKDFYLSKDGWYVFIFEDTTVLCTIPVGISLGYFVETGNNSVELSPMLKRG